MTGNELRTWREGKGLTAEAAAFKLGVPLAQRLKWEARAKKPIPKNMAEAILLHDHIKEYLRTPSTERSPMKAEPWRWSK